MKILLLGSGGREHAFAWKISKSPLCEQLYIAPGNAGTSTCGDNIPLDPNDFEQVKAFCVNHAIDMVVVGPEAPLVHGIYDFFKKDPQLAAIAVIGPSKEGAQLEGSKAYAKEFMQEFDIPTAAYRAFSAAQRSEALAFIDQQTPPIVLKADGLAAGKGVLILDSKEAAKRELRAMFDGKFGAAGQTVVIEAFLKGMEFSVFVATDGTSFKIMPIAKDYKRIGEGDTGLNTGGMGAVSPVPFVDSALMDKVITDIVEPTIQGLQKRHIDYKGFIFLGLIVVDGAPFVIEYNCRMGDPETEVVLPRIKSDIVPIFDAIAQGTLANTELKIDMRAAATIMLVSGGYPLAYEKGKPISGIESITDSIVFQAGTRKEGDTIHTNGGRVIAVTSYGNSFEDALALSYKNIERIHFEGKHFRSDIGWDLK